MRLLVLLLFLLTSPLLRAQMDRTEMIDQIAGLQLYLAEAEKSYQIVHQGLSTIGEIKQGDLNLHQVFFNSLQLVNPEIRSYIKIADIITMQAEMLTEYKQYYRQASGSHLFTAAELSYMSTFYSAILGKTGDDISELTGILTDSNWQMDDAQRLDRIDRLYASVTAQYQTLQNFNNHIQVLALQKNQTLLGLQNLTQLIHP
jgi:hypothetical protein